MRQVKAALLVACLLLLLAALASSPALRRLAGMATPPPFAAVQTDPASNLSPVPAALPSFPAVTSSKTGPRALALGLVPAFTGTGPATHHPAAIARRYQLPASHLSDCGSCGLALYRAVSQFPGVLAINRFLGGDLEVELLTDPALFDESRLLDLLSTTSFEPGSGDLTQDQPWIKPGPP